MTWDDGKAPTSPRHVRNQTWGKAKRRDGRGGSRLRDLACALTWVPQASSILRLIGANIGVWSCLLESHRLRTTHTGTPRLLSTPNAVFYIFALSDLPLSHALFFISLSFPMTLTGSVSPVAFLCRCQPLELLGTLHPTHCASGVSRRMKTFHVFSSAMVDFPVVQLSDWARDASLAV